MYNRYIYDTSRPCLSCLRLQTGYKVSILNREEHRPLSVMSVGDGLCHVLVLSCVSFSGFGITLIDPISSLYLPLWSAGGCCEGARREQLPLKAVHG